MLCEASSHMAAGHYPHSLSNPIFHSSETSRVRPVAAATTADGEVGHPLLPLVPALSSPPRCSAQAHSARRLPASTLPTPALVPLLPLYRCCTAPDDVALDRHL